MALTRQVVNLKLNSLYKHFQKDTSSYNWMGIYALLKSANINSEERLDMICELLKFKIYGEVQFKIGTVARQPLGPDWERAISDLNRFNWDLRRLITMESEPYSPPFASG